MNTSIDIKMMFILLTFALVIFVKLAITNYSGNGYLFAANIITIGFLIYEFFNVSMFAYIYKKYGNKSNDLEYRKFKKISLTNRINIFKMTNFFSQNKDELYSNNFNEVIYNVFSNDIKDINKNIIENENTLSFNSSFKYFKEHS